MADFNGDGCPDFLITELGALPNLPMSGVYILLNDCHGHFSKITDTLPPQIVEKTIGSFIPDPSIDYQSVYHAGAADLNGDGVIDLITGSGGTGDPSGQHTLRIFDESKGYTEAARLPLPAAIFGLNLSQGIVTLSFGDIDGDGQVDVIANAESLNGRSWVIIYTNLGNFNFSDVTLEYLPGYETTFTNAAGQSTDGNTTRTLRVSLTSPVDTDIGLLQSAADPALSLFRQVFVFKLRCQRFWSLDVHPARATGNEHRQSPRLRRPLRLPAALLRRFSAGCRCSSMSTVTG